MVSIDSLCQQPPDAHKAKGHRKASRTEEVARKEEEAVADEVEREGGIVRLRQDAHLPFF
jgi:hypothetical protein